MRFNKSLLWAIFTTVCISNVAFGAKASSKTPAAWVEKFISWHDETFGDKKNTPTLPALKEFFADDITFIVNDNIRATDFKGVQKLYESMFERAGKTYFKKPLTEISIFGNMGILRFDQRLVDNEGKERSLKGMVKLSFNTEGKVSQFVEVFTISEITTKPIPTLEKDMQVIVSFVSWHNSVFAMKDRKTIKNDDLVKLFNKDTIFKVNGYSVATDVNGMLQNYENIAKKGHKLVQIDLPFYGTYKTEGGYVVFHTVELVDKEGTSTSNHAASFFRIVNGKISEYIEVYASGKPKK